MLTGVYRIPGGYLVPVLSTVAVLWFLSSLPREELRAMTIFLAVLTVVYGAMRFFGRKALTPNERSLE